MLSLRQTLWEKYDNMEITYLTYIIVKFCNIVGGAVKGEKRPGLEY